MTNTNWTTLMTHFQFQENLEELEYLTTMYSKPNRAYHNLNHIIDCLQKLNRLNDSQPIEYKPEIELAFWFHDVIYDPYLKDNELKSAESAKLFLEKQKTNNSTLYFIYDLIMATIHKIPPKNESEAIMMDIDISILGSSPTIYKTYCDNIRKEYKMVPNFLYKRNRIKILEMFLNRKELYYTTNFKNQYETQARINIKNEIATLKGR